MPANPTKGTRQTSFELPIDLLDRLKQFASGRGEKLVEVVATALRRHMANPPPLPGDVPLPPLTPTTPVAEVPTDASIAAALGVTVEQMDLASRVHKYGTPELVKAVEAGRVTLQDAVEMLKLTPGRQRQAALKASRPKK